jgi:hypothetical protein
VRIKIETTWIRDLGELSGVLVSANYGLLNPCLHGHRHSNFHPKGVAIVDNWLIKTKRTTVARVQAWVAVERLRGGRSVIEKVGER